MSFWMLLAGFMGSSCIGIILDKTKKFRLITFVVTCFYFALYLVFSFLYIDGIWLFMRYQSYAIYELGHSESAKNCQIGAQGLNLKFFGKPEIKFGIFEI